MPAHTVGPAHPVGTAEDHLRARLELLAAEKDMTRLGDELARRRRALPWVAVEKIPSPERGTQRARL